MKELRAAIASYLFMAAAISIQPAAGGETRENKSEKSAPTLPELRRELLAREATDQEVRRKVLDWIKAEKLSFDALADEEHAQEPVVQQWKRVDRENQAWLKAAVERYGWPGRSLVGVDGAHAAWLLAQHAQHDFQRQCLRQMKECPAGEVAKIDLAYLADRVLLAEGKPQLYGTQIEVRDGRWQPRQVEDPENLDRRRQEIGLPPIAQYLKDAEEAYGPAGQSAAENKSGNR